MNANVEDRPTRADTVKLSLAALLLVAGIYGFYFFEAHSLLLRVLGLLAIAGLAGFIAIQTASGKAIWEFFGEAKTEVRKVVWPSRQETIQTTVVVLATVVVMGLLLWLFDMVLLAIVKALTGHGG